MSKTPYHQSPLCMRDREIRDIFKQLGKKYRYNIVIGVITQHYFITEPGIQHLLSRVDDKEVKKARASAQYKTLMNSNFKV